MSTFALESVSYRRDRDGESWHMVPPGERGNQGRTLCGEPRQGTRLSETYAETPPLPPESVCGKCAAAQIVRSTASPAN